MFARPKGEAPMQRLMTKFWKEIAYLVGFAVLVVLQLETIGLFYLGAGTVWFVVWLLRNNDPGRASASGILSDEATSLPQPYGRDYGTLSAKDPTVIFNASHFHQH